MSDTLYNSMKILIKHDLKDLSAAASKKFECSA